MINLSAKQGLALFTTLVCSFISSAQEPLISDINKRLIPIKTLSFDSDFSDLQNVPELIKDKRLVGLGEATHGTHEFYAMKCRLIRFMVEKLGYRTVILESDFSGTQAMNDYILNKSEGGMSSVIPPMLSALADERAFADLVEWLRHYNSTQESQNRVQIWGCDMQFGINTVKAIQDGVIKFQSPITPRINQGLDLIKNWGYNKLNKGDLAVLESAMEQLAALQLSEPDTQRRKICQQDIAVLIQSAKYMAPPYLLDKDKIRDQCMADNAVWIYNFLSGNKTILWLHNLHLSKDIPANSKVRPMGYYLDQTFAGQYYVIGSGFNSGMLRGYDRVQQKAVIYSVPDVSIKNSSDYIFNQASVPVFMLDFKTASSDAPVAAFLNTRMNARSIGGRYNPQEQAGGSGGTTQALMKMYDAIIFFKNTTAAFN